MLVFAAFVVLFFVLWGVAILIEPLVRHTLSRTAHLTAKFRYRDYLSVYVVLGSGAAVALYAGDGFVDLAELVRAQSPMLQGIDAKWHDWAVSERSPGATTFFALMSVIGGPVVMGLTVGITAGALFIRRRWRWAGYLLVTACGGAILNMTLKHFFERARPALAEALRRAHGYSFPSGHAMGSTIVTGALVYLAARVLATWPQKASAIAAGITFVAAVAASRVYLGVHWISDIGAGVAAGLIWLATTTVAYETFRRIRLIRALRAKRSEGMRDEG